MQVWTITNQKGGVGKTTTTVTLGGLLSQRGYKTLLIDMDPQGSLTTYFKHDPDTIRDGVYALFNDQDNQTVAKIKGLIRTTEFDQLSLLPASTAMSTLDRQLGTRDGMGLVLFRALEQISSDYEYVLIDCPPALGVLMINAIAAADRILIPVQTEFLALKGLERMVRTISMVLRAHNKPLPYLIVPTMFDRRTRASIDTLENLQENYNEYLWDSVIPVDTRFREASSKGLPLSIMSKSTHGAKAYHNLTETLLNNESVEYAQAEIK